jgi:hypothetical protein
MVVMNGPNNQEGLAGRCDLQQENQVPGSYTLATHEITRSLRAARRVVFVS